MRNRVITMLQKKSIVPNLVFDVGANIGQSVLEFRQSFPEATIYAFEPIKAAFEKLSTIVDGDIKASAHQVGLSRTSGDATMTSSGHSTGNRIVRNNNNDRAVEIVPLKTGDDFCSERNIEYIDFLKIDAEGHDLDVVLGFRNMLISKKIKFVQVECGLARQNSIHVPFADFHSLMASFGYGFVGFFGLVPLRGTNNMGAHYGDAVFVCDA
jgi:FkbM family methyltransferase